MGTYPEQLQPVIDELLPLCRALGEGARAVSLGGSYGKGVFDDRSDLDFRLFCERRLAPPDAYSAAYTRLQAAIDRWAARGVTIDGCWVRTIAPIEDELEAWIQGRGRPAEILWTIWGYYLVTDVHNQMVIEDPDGILAGWRARLSSYPEALKRTTLERHLSSIRYWRNDYHYRSKVERTDAVFLAGLTSKLVHDLVQILFALNETYYPGDGNNLTFIEGFNVAPAGFSERVAAILYPCGRADASDGTSSRAIMQAQYARLMDLIDEVETLVAEPRA